MTARMGLFGLVMLQAALLAVEVFLLVSEPKPTTIGATVFVAVMLVVTILNYQRVR